jgi:predicted peptidase
MEVALMTLAAAFPLAAQAKIDGFVGRVYHRGRASMPYRLFVPPGYDKTQSYPLVIWLHGAGGAGDDNRLEIENDQTLGTHTWTRPDVQAKHPAFVLVPQSPGVWIHQLGGLDLSDEEQLVVEILASVKSEFSIDAKRVYLAGQSNGGFGTWDLVMKRPDLFAAAIPLCGGGDTALAPRVANMPIWAFHGDKDATIPVEDSRQMIAAIRKAGGKPRYTEYKGVDHDVWTPAFKEPGLVEWLFAQHK